MIATATKGFVIGLGLIAPLGMQNAWVLDHGIRQHHHLTAAAICVGCDVVLINLGVYGSAALDSGTGGLSYSLTLGSIIFLGCYSAYLLWGLARKVVITGADAPGANLSGDPKGRSSKGIWVVVGGTLMVTLLNPHVFAERIVMLGAISSDVHTDARMHFAAGAVAASFVWFFVISTGAARLGQVLSRPPIRIALDLAVVVMLVGFTVYLSIGLLENEQASFTGLVSR